MLGAAPWNDPTAPLDDPDDDPHQIRRDQEKLTGGDSTLGLDPPVDELILLVDAENRPVGPIPRSRMRRENLWHRASFVFIRTKIGLLLAQLRSKEKDYCPSHYDTTTGGVVGAEEASDMDGSAAREVGEEVGIAVESPAWRGAMFPEGVQGESQGQDHELALGVGQGTVPCSPPRGPIVAGTRGFLESSEHRGGGAGDDVHAQAGRASDPSSAASTGGLGDSLDETDGDARPVPVRGSRLSFLGWTRYEDDRARCWCAVYDLLVPSQPRLRLQASEVDEARWMSLEEIQRGAQAGQRWTPDGLEVLKRYATAMDGDLGRDDAPAPVGKEEMLRLCPGVRSLAASTMQSLNSMRGDGYDEGEGREKGQGGDTTGGSLGTASGMKQSVGMGMDWGRVAALTAGVAGASVLLHCMRDAWRPTQDGMASRAYDACAVPGAAAVRGMEAARASLRGTSTGSIKPTGVS